MDSLKGKLSRTRCESRAITRKLAQICDIKTDRSVQGLSMSAKEVGADYSVNNADRRLTQMTATPSFLILLTRGRHLSPARGWCWCWPANVGVMINSR